MRVVQIIVPICTSIVSLLLYNFSTDWWSNFSEILKKKYFSRNYNSSYFYSSVFCRGNSHTDRLCRFRNLCFEPQTESFVFFQGPKSIKSGLPSDRFSPALVDFSSVYDHNTQYFNYVELPDFSIKNFNTSFTDGDGLIFKRFNPDNLMHVFHDDLIPVYMTLLELSILESTDTFLILADTRPPGNYSVLYEKFLISKPVYIQSLPKKYLHCFRSSYVGLNKQSTWYQYGFKEPQGPLLKPNIGSIIHSFREYFLNHFSLKYHIGRSHASLLVRKYNRKILNKDEVIKTINVHTELETDTVSLDTSSVLEVIQKIMDSNLVIGMHGSLLILSIFLKPHSIIIELFPYGINPNISTPYKTLCELSDLKLFYRTWKNDIESNSYPHPEYPPNLGGITHLPSKEQEYILNSFVKPFLCCDNPAWLYRIYQDTIVDTHNFGLFLQDVLQDHKKVLITDQYHKSWTEDYSQFSEYQLHPGEIQNAVCNISFESKAILTLVWDQPWNLKFMTAVKVDYEIWLQEIGGDNVQAFLTKSNKFVFPLESIEKAYYSWIRCYANEMVGPFTSNPIICSSELTHSDSSNHLFLDIM
ncbi:protein O-linked-mannose beta-1,4-N-acetylglucosaminyltransferase 2 [Trichonephila clavata]|uniref:Protein O-linked-mannose beta-1,4-N-acetylglucosaminyltransferase 2 n=1 Tax=Trichonephila clavata TaxID=2740835 RepID=A0A8X6EYX9_TRICU|nr:protein O-linked-mannose beta-1,4-N-acetylglucosaminyltransferase 2 [Trichonephila clavata]